jgi:hypothetical protein
LNQVSVILILLVMTFVQPSVEPRTEDISGEYEMKCESSNFVFQGDEELVYKLYYNLDFIWIPAGEVRFSVREDDRTYIYHAVGTTYPSYEWFYKVNDEYTTVVDKKTLLPLSAERSLEEGGYRLYEEVDFDHKKKAASVFRGRELADATDRGAFGIENCAGDILSLMYRMRNIDRQSFMEAGSMPVSFFLDMKTHKVDIRLIRSEPKKIKGLGRYNTIKVNPSLIAGKVFRKGDEMSVWVSDDDNRIPLMIKSPLTVGSVKAVLTSYTGLKYPLQEI